MYNIPSAWVNFHLGRVQFVCLSVISGSFIFNAFSLITCQMMVLNAFAFFSRKFIFHIILLQFVRRARVLHIFYMFNT